MLYIIKLTDNLDDNLEITRRGSRISLHREMLLEGAAENGPFWTHMRCRTTLSRDRRCCYLYTPTCLFVYCTNMYLI